MLVIFTRAKMLKPKSLQPDVNPFEGPTPRCIGSDGDVTDDLLKLCHLSLDRIVGRALAHQESLSRNRTVLDCGHASQLQDARPVPTVNKSSQAVEATDGLIDHDSDKPDEVRENDRSLHPRQLAQDTAFLANGVINPSHSSKKADPMWPRKMPATGSLEMPKLVYTSQEAELENNRLALRCIYLVYCYSWVSENRQGLFAMKLQQICVRTPENTQDRVKP